MIIACLPTVTSYYPVQATAMANVTATSLVSIRSTTAGWIVGGSNYVGCVSTDNTQYSMGIRFPAVPLPQGATINSAYLVVTSSGTYSQNTVSSIIQGEDADTANVFAGTYVDYDGRPKTTATVPWYGIDTWTLGSDYVSPDISTVVSEVVNRAGWASGNNMVLFWDDRAKASSQSAFMPANVRGGSSYKLVVDYTDATVVTPSTLTTLEASDVGSTTAIFNAYINDDGDDTNGVAVRFGYDTITHAGNFALYGTIGSWLSSNYTTGEPIYEALTGLTPSTTYFVSVQGQNSAGYTTGNEIQFVTPPSSTALAPSSFIILPSSTSMDLGWTKPSGFSASKLYYSVGSIPTSNVTGTLLYSGSNPYYTHSSLTSGTTYGYRVYGYESGVWSASTTGIMTTTGTSTSPGLTTPTTPLGWFIDTDYTTQNQTFIYPIINNLADSFSMPRDTAWYTWALGLSMFFGFLVWSASRSMMMVAIAVCAGILLGAAQGILPKATILLILAFAIPIIAVRERI